MTATLTIELHPEAARKLASLAERSGHPAEELAAEAVAFYIERETSAIEGIARGLADMKAGRLVPHDEAMDELDAAIASAAASR